MTVPPSIRVGSGLDVHAFSDAVDRALVLGGVTIPDGPGLDGHSDADAVAHAVADALLGAAALGDLGARFGVDDPDVAGADSIELLRAVVADLADAGWRPANVDATVVAQRPRLAPHRAAMRERLADALELPLPAVSVKATTTDRLGSVGRGEGIACWAVCTIEPRSGATA